MFGGSKSLEGAVLIYAYPTVLNAAYTYLNVYIYIDSNQNQGLLVGKTAD